jgi:biopolymer transport protein TolR
MGMTVGNGKGTFCDPNIVPLIDILLVLIIIFMVIQPPAKSIGHKADVPQPADNPDAPPVPQDQIIVVQVLDRDSLKINDEPHTWESLGPRLQAIFNRRAEKVAFVKGDDAVLFEQVARAIDVMRSSGAGRIGLLSAKMAGAH